MTRPLDWLDATAAAQERAWNEHKRECLAREICRLPSVARRRQRLENLRRRHGDALVADLTARMTRLWAAGTRG